MSKNASVHSATGWILNEEMIEELYFFISYAVPVYAGLAVLAFIATFAGIVASTTAIALAGVSCTLLMVHCLVVSLHLNHYIHR